MIYTSLQPVTVNKGPRYREVAYVAIKEAIFEAISQRDPEAAARLVIYHTQSLRERFAALFNGLAEGLAED
jgi:DNA-binding FadR family transcriptional regulator